MRPPAVNGLGTVHHVAMAIATPTSSSGLREELLQLGLQVTEVRDRCYFQSIYFREPGGVLFEVATIQPGSPSTRSWRRSGASSSCRHGRNHTARASKSGLAPVEYR